MVSLQSCGALTINSNRDSAGALPTAFIGYLSVSFPGQREQEEANESFHLKVPVWGMMSPGPPASCPSDAPLLGPLCSLPGVHRTSSSIFQWELCSWSKLPQSSKTKILSPAAAGAHLHLQLTVY